MDFPIQDLMDEDKCYQWLIKFLHDGILKSPYSNNLHFRVNDSRSAPVIQYVDTETGKTFNVYSGTVFQGTHFKCSTIILIIRGFIQGVSTAQMARELDMDYQNLLELRHEFMACGYANMDKSRLSDSITEIDEMFQNSGEKGIKHPDINDPPRRRANKKRGHGTYKNDRPPIVGTVGRESGEIRLAVVQNTKSKELMQQVSDYTEKGCTVNTDEWSGYQGIDKSERTHQTVCHAKKEYAKDMDNDGINEVHTNTIEGIWVGLRNYLRIFRGVAKKYLHLYCAVFQINYNNKIISPKAVQELCLENRKLTI